jgi:hypothetical protein
MQSSMVAAKDKIYREIQNTARQLYQNGDQRLHGEMADALIRQYPDRKLNRKRILKDIVSVLETLDLRHRVKGLKRAD